MAQANIDETAASQQNSVDGKSNEKLDKARQEFNREICARWQNGKNRELAEQHPIFFPWWPRPPSTPLDNIIRAHYLLPPQPTDKLLTSFLCNNEAITLMNGLIRTRFTRDHVLQMDPTRVSMEVLDEVMPYMFPSVHPIDENTGEVPNGDGPVKISRGFLCWYSGDRNITDECREKTLQNFEWFFGILSLVYVSDKYEDAQAEAPAPQQIEEITSKRWILPSDVYQWDPDTNRPLEKPRVMNIRGIMLSQAGKLPDRGYLWWQYEKYWKFVKVWVFRVLRYLRFLGFAQESALLFLTVVEITVFEFRNIQKVQRRPDLPQDLNGAFDDRLRWLDWYWDILYRDLRDISVINTETNRAQPQGRMRTCYSDILEYRGSIAIADDLGSPKYPRPYKPLKSITFDENEFQSFLQEAGLPANIDPPEDYDHDRERWIKIFKMMRSPEWAPAPAVASTSDMPPPPAPPQSSRNVPKSDINFNPPDSPSRSQKKSSQSGPTQFKKKSTNKNKNAPQYRGLEGRGQAPRDRPDPMRPRPSPPKTSKNTQDPEVGRSSPATPQTPAIPPVDIKLEHDGYNFTFHGNWDVEFMDVSDIPQYTSTPCKNGLCADHYLPAENGIHEEATRSYHEPAPPTAHNVSALGPPFQHQYQTPFNRSEQLTGEHYDSENDDRSGSSFESKTSTNAIYDFDHDSESEGYSDVSSSPLQSSPTPCRQRPPSSSIPTPASTAFTIPNTSAIVPTPLRPRPTRIPIPVAYLRRSLAASQPADSPSPVLNYTAEKIYDIFTPWIAGAQLNTTPHSPVPSSFEDTLYSVEVGRSSPTVSLARQLSTTSKTPASSYPLGSLEFSRSTKNNKKRKWGAYESDAATHTGSPLAYPRRKTNDMELMPSKQSFPAPQNSSYQQAEDEDEVSYGDSYVGWDAENPPPPQKKQRSLSLSKVWEAAKSVFSGEKS